MATSDQRKASALGEQAIALAEQLGRIAGTIEGTAETWLNRESLAEQLTRVRDGAAQMLDSLADGADRGRAAATGVQTAAADVRQKAARVLAAASAGRAAQKKSSANNRNKKSSSARPAASMRPNDPSHAPGKRRRKPAPTTPGLKKSDERIPKLRTAEAVRQRRKSYA